MFCPVTYFGLSLELLTPPSYLCHFLWHPIYVYLWLLYLSCSWQVVSSFPTSGSLLHVLAVTLDKWMQYPRFTSPALLWTWHPSGLEPSHVYPFPRLVRVPRAPVFAQKVMPYEAYHPNTDHFNVLAGLHLEKYTLCFNSVIDEHVFRAICKTLVMLYIANRHIL